VCCLARGSPVGYEPRMYGYGTAWRASSVALECPHCRTAQLRARLPAGTLYSCQACKRTFRPMPEAVAGKKPKKKR
jgi:hypothetical protein